MEEEEHEVYGGEIPDVEGDMDPHNADVDMSAADDDAVKELNEMKKRLKEMEEEAAALREIQAKVEKEMGAVQGRYMFVVTVMYGQSVSLVDKGSIHIGSVFLSLAALIDPASAAGNQANKEEADSRSVFVGNVRNMMPFCLY
ncbi:hypothetical protein SADUNF_Sadunf07G0083200 [Salix dunnii]|uniref:Polyadenylate-binding protein 2 n=1 Tax=Salix dunnii TaxID=1413687 RepID=A0A835MVH1_9ROSI|nr:hypothetical protein SADUNF_Sadunf07G0083200 [Salix dunnii]